MDKRKLNIKKTLALKQEPRVNRKVFTLRCDEDFKENLKYMARSEMKNKIIVNLNFNENIPFDEEKERIEECIAFIEKIQQEHHLSNALVELNINI
ncbi:hypothetical protein LV469_03090 [Peptoniphilus sp. GNH]|nr:hypothetical protein LV469_03090 [Peptoniphilus sp. GNH]